MPPHLQSRSSVLEAIVEFDALGRRAFLAKYGFQQARSYFLEFEGKLYDSKAIVGAAIGHETGAPLSAADFSGGEATVQKWLEALDFRVVRTTPSDWRQLQIGDVLSNHDLVTILASGIWEGCVGIG
jgi:hypothetical protein